MSPAWAELRSDGTGCLEMGDLAEDLACRWGNQPCTEYRAPRHKAGNSRPAFPVLVALHDAAVRTLEKGERPMKTPVAMMMMGVLLLGSPVLSFACKGEKGEKSADSAGKSDSKKDKDAKKS